MPHYTTPQSSRGGIEAGHHPQHYNTSKDKTQAYRLSDQSFMVRAKPSEGTPSVVRNIRY